MVETRVTDLSSEGARQAGDTHVDGEASGRSGWGLSTKLLVLTVVFVMLAEVLIFVPSISNFRRNWLADKVGAAGTAALVIDASPAGMVSPELSERVLQAVGATTIAVGTGPSRKLIASLSQQPPVNADVDLRRMSAVQLIGDALETLLTPHNRMIRVVGPGMDMDLVEVVLEERPLREAMIRFSINILLLSLFISGLTAVMVYLALLVVIVRPVRRLSRNMAAFEAAPEDASRIVAFGPRGDEIGVAERALAGMQGKLAAELKENRRLAMLGLAVAKISHDLRNILTGAQLLSDRIAALPDPTVQKFAPRLFDAVGRAVALCEATLSYGRASETAPARAPFTLHPLVEEVMQLLEPGADSAIAIINAVPPDLTIDADRDQMFRVLLNLARNAAHALAKPRLDGAAGGRIEIAAMQEAGRVQIDVIDNGPGVPPPIRARLFEPFSVTTNPSGSGLGLAIAAELVRGHGGEIALLEHDGVGARFRISLPQS